MIANGAPTPVAVTARITPKSVELDRLMVVSRSPISYYNITTQERRPRKPET
jgi:hypothetical protein